MDLTASPQVKIRSLTECYFRQLVSRQCVHTGRGAASGQQQSFVDVNLRYGAQENTNETTDSVHTHRL